MREFMIKMMDRLNKVYAKLFKKCLTPKKNVKSKKVTKKVLGLGQNKSGVLRVVRSRQKRGKGISQRKLLRHYLLKSMLNQLEKNEKILKRESSTVSNQRKLQEKQELTEK